MTKKHAVKTCTTIFRYAFPIAVLLLTPVMPVYAQSGPGLSETTLVFHGLVNETLQRTFTLTVDEPIQGVTVVRPDLVDASTDRAIVSDNVTVDPASKDTVAGPERFAVTVNTGDKAGHYTGNLEILYQDQPDDALLVVTLDVTVEPVPSVDTDINSKNPALAVEPPWDSGPFGQPSADEISPVLGEVVISLVQSAEGEAIVEQATPLAFRNARNQTLPDEAVRVATDFPLSLSDTKAASVRVVAGGQNLRAGEYDGTILFQVRNQSAPIQVPLKVLVKDGPWLPLLLLAIGPIVGLLINWWNSEGMSRRNLMKEIDALESKIKQGWCSVKTREAAGALLKKAQDAMVDGGKVEEITELLKEANDLIDADRAAAEDFNKKLTPMRAKIDGIKLGREYCAQQKASLDDVERQLNDGTYWQLEDLEGALEKVNQNVTSLEKVIAECDTLMPNLSDAVKTSLEAALNEADSIAAMNEAIEQARQTSAKPGEEALVIGPYSLMRPKGVEKEERLIITPRQLAWKRERTRLKWGSIAVAVVVYVFTLAVGMITLYVTPSTFGADPQDYVTLFLWGLASNLLGGQAIDLKALHTKAKESN